MLGRQHHVRGPENRVRPRREDADRRIRARHRKLDFRALGFPDPVPLGRLRGVRPIDPIEIGQQTRRVLRDPEKPLLEKSLLDRRTAPLAGAVHHLLVGQHRFARGTPVDRRLAAIRQTALQQLQENPLGPLVVRRIGGGQLVRPVDHEPNAAQLAPEVLDVARDQLHRVDADLERIVLRVDAERVEPERLEHRVSLETLESSIDVVPREREHVADVQSFGRRVREHHQLVERTLRAVQVGRVGPLGAPALLPFALDGNRIVARRARRRGVGCRRSHVASRRRRGTGMVRRHGVNATPVKYCLGEI